MKYIGFLLLIILLSPKISSAQKIELINSGELIKSGTTLHDSGEYKKAIAVYSKISRSDTNYVYSLYERALTFEADSQYAQALKYAEEALSLKEQREYEPDIYNVYGNTLSDMGQPEKALKAFDAGIAKYPAYALLYFNKGVVYLTMKRPDEAEQWFQKTLLISPYMYSAHYQLGLAALRQGKIIPAFLSFIGYITVNPQGRYLSASIKMLDQISKSTDDVLEFKNNRTVPPGENYQEVEDIVLSKIALDKQYKPIISLDDPVSRQIQAVIEKLEYKEGDKDFYMQYYLPYFKKIYNDGKFELFINHIFSGIKIQAIQDYNKKKKKELEAFVGEAADYFNDIRGTRELSYKKRDSITERYLFDNGSLYGKGTLANKGKILTGKWVAYYPGGNLKGTGNYNPTGDRIGEWLYYYHPGTLKAKEHYNNGKQEGMQDYYFTNGNPSSHQNYVNGESDGLLTRYYYAGEIKSTTYYKAGKKNGEQRIFYSNGNLESVNNYVNDLQTGASHEYYKNGHLKNEGIYSNGKAEGPYKLYYETGSVSTEGQFSKDNSEGAYKVYYENGKIKEKRNYVNNAEEGVHEEYFENGQISFTYTAKKGKINGEATHYYKNGKVLATYIYDNGVVKSAKYFARSGKQLSASETTGSLLSIVAYDVDENKKAHFTNDQKGKLDGNDTLFYPSGKIFQINTYKDDELNGPAITYYLNGNKKSEVIMTDGKDNGLYTSFYPNGQLETEGWMQEGESQGEWDYYDELGRLSTRSYYEDGDLSGYKEEYSPNGKKTFEEKYHGGWLDRLIQYDTTGKVLVVDTFPKSSGKYTVVHSNGKPMIEANYVNGDFNGIYKTYFFDGSVATISFYKKGLRDSTYSSFYYGGAKDNEGHYKGGNKSGLWKSYDEDGKLYSTSEYVNGDLNGDRTYYFPNGNKEQISAYKDDLLNGIYKKFDTDGTPAFQVTFDDDNAKSFSYIGSDGKLMPDISLMSTNGVVKAYYQNGKLSRECKYSDGVKNGTDIVYYTTGQVRTISSEVYGISEGVSKEFYPDGKLKYEYFYKNDNATGICKDFNRKGTVKKEITYDNGITHGPVKYYDENGNLIKTMSYYYGTLISVKNGK